MTPNGYRFIGIAPEVDLTERRSKLINDQTEPFTVDEIRGYKVFTALLTQSGGNDIQSINTGLLTIGTTYFINDTQFGMDFTNVGAPNNNVGTYFVATGTIPNSWGIDTEAGVLTFNTGAPVTTVLENTIGNIWFNYEDVGVYGCKSNDLFTDSKTFVSATPGEANSVSILVTNQSTSVKYISSLNNSLNAFNDGLYNTPIEIRVYN